ncbi:hypothetical protein [Sphaerimonospora mesophila]|uniref:hypothetical protein n=1 Tax=Sphaerimonospora mesophila TaxID=37483 RepID=UPI0006E134C4
MSSWLDEFLKKIRYRMRPKMKPVGVHVIDQGECYIYRPRNFRDEYHFSGSRFPIPGSNFRVIWVVSGFLCAEEPGATGLVSCLNCGFKKDYMTKAEVLQHVDTCGRGDA